MDVEVFKKLCKEIVPDCYIRCVSKRIPIVDVYLWHYGPYFAHFWEGKCVAWPKSVGFCGKCDWTAKEFKALRQKVKLSYGK